MQFNITFKTIFEYVLKKLVLCIQIRFVSTEKNTRIASRASCYIIIIKFISLSFVIKSKSFCCVDIMLPFHRAIVQSVWKAYEY